MGKDESESPEKEEGTPQEELKVEKEGKKLKISQKDYDRLIDDLAKARADSEHWKNEYYRAYADMNNLRKSLEEDHRSALRYRSQGFLEKLLPALDSYYMAMNISPKSDEAKNYQQGFIYIYNQIQSALEEEGVKEFTPKVGDDFDSATMHALDTVEGEDNKITKVYSKGYKLHDRLVRSAMVQVSVAKKDEEKEETSEAKADEPAEA